jgi:type II secretory pathway pseudopilin PulG
VTWRSAVSRRGGDRDEGFTLIEAVASLVVFAIAAVSVVALLETALHLSRKNQQRVQAAQLAMQAVSTARDGVKHSLAIPDELSENVTVGSTVFTVVTRAAWTNVGASDSSCAGAVPGQVAYRRIEATVTWPRMTGTPAVKSATLATPLNPNTITVPVQLVTGAKVPLSGQTITLTPPTGASQAATTDANGCVVFAQLTPQRYTVSVNVSGYVDATSDAKVDHQEVVGQSVPGITQVTTIFYDRPGTLSLGPAFSSGGSPAFSAANYPLPSSGMAYTLSQTGWSDGSSHTYPASSGSLSRTVFPFQVAPGSGYTAYAGACAATANPVSTALGTPAAGGTATLDVPVVSKVIKVTRFNNPQANVTVTASDSPSGCGDTYTLSGRTSSSGTIAFSLPAGSYQFSAEISGRTRRSGTVDVTTSSSSVQSVSFS